MVSEPRAASAGDNEVVAAYKQFLSDIIDRRPSGTRLKLAAALSKNRSFVSQITSASYPVPVPANHLDVIFEVCRFSDEEKRKFLELYSKAHPKRLALVQSGRKLKAHTFYLPDLEDEDLNAQLHVLVTDFVRQVAGLMTARKKRGGGA